MLNVGGRIFASYFELPFWLDSFGTVLAAYMGGPVVGSMVGVTGNIIYGLYKDVTFIYGLTSIAIGIIVGEAVKRGKMKDAFGTMSVSSLVAIVCLVISVPLNLTYYKGSTGNLWGDGVMNYLMELGYPKILCMIIGQFYLEFLDKLLVLILLFACMHIWELIRNKKNPKDTSDQEAEEKYPYEEMAEELAEEMEEEAHHPKHGNGGRITAGIVLLALLFSGSTSVKAAGNKESSIDYDDYVQTVFSSNNGLPCGEANDIVETNDGILWIGTYAGLYRYNGKEFRWMNSYDSVRNVNCLYVDTEGRLWIGTNDNGLSISINEKIVNVIDTDHGLPSNSVRCIAQGADGYYYIGTSGSMQVLSLNSGLKKINTLTEVNYSDRIASDEFGHVAVVTADGRLFLLGEGRIRCSLQTAENETPFSCCAFDGSGHLYAGTSGGRIHIYDISSGFFKHIKAVTCEKLTSLQDIRFMENGEIFVTADNGIGYMDRGGFFRSINTNSFNSSIDHMLVDYQDNLWFTSSRLGLLRLSPSSFKDVYSTIGMKGRVVNCVTKWKNRYYFGTDQGLDIADGELRKQIHNSLTEQFKEARIRCIFKDSREHLWICTYGQGLVEIEENGTQYSYNQSNGSFGNRSRLVSELSDGTIVAAGDTGLSFIRDHEIIKTIGYEDKKIQSMVLSVTEMSDGRIFAGTDGDGIALIENYEVTRMLTKADGLSSEVILRTVRDKKSEGMYIVTSNGLCYMDEEGRIRLLDNFPYFNNYDLWTEDGEKLFVSGSSGIYVVNRYDVLDEEKTEISYELLDSRKGLTGTLTANSWNYSDDSGDLFLCCDRGVYILDTGRYGAEGRSYLMMIPVVTMDGEARKVEQGNPIVIGRGVSRVEFQQELINYTIQDPNLGYYLEGFESDWKIAPQSSVNSIVYTNLPSGEFTLHLAVFDSNKKKALEERLYTVIKEKEIYDNRWFKIYMLLTAALAIAWFTWFFVKTQMKKTLEVQKREMAVMRQQAQMGNETIIAIAKAVDAKDVRTAQHSARVATYSTMIGREMGLSENELQSLRRTALMHDIGKIGIPDSVLNKPGRLTDEEYGVMKSHTSRGGDILKGFTLLDHVVEGALYHHERYDGRGYPQGLKGEEIPLFARIIGTADAFDAMTANRIYRKQMDFDYVINELRKGRGTQFDPVSDDILLKLIEDGKINLKELYPELLNPEEAEKKAKMTDEEKEAAARKVAEDEAKAIEEGKVKKQDEVKEKTPDEKQEMKKEAPDKEGGVA